MCKFFGFYLKCRLFIYYTLYLSLFLSFGLFFFINIAPMDTKFLPIRKILLPWCCFIMKRLPLFIYIYIYKYAVYIRLSLKRKYKYQNKAKHSMTKVNEKNMIFKSLHNDFGLLTPSLKNWYCYDKIPSESEQSAHFLN